MNRIQLTRIFIVLVLVVLPLAWTGYMQAVEPDATISQQVFDLCTKYGPKGLMIPVIWGVATGHFFFSGSYQKCQICGAKR